jgi:hypothetical protein
VQQYRKRVNAIYFQYNQNHTSFLASRKIKTCL